ncbi:PD40 domain-containing protein [candidate division KSB1 bacterium]|nr:PD40 domain-containing protein [candidate division KSB1 bacterium]
MKSFLYIILLLTLCGLLVHCESTQAPIQIIYPLDGAMFPPDIASPEIRWTDDEDASKWEIVFEFGEDDDPIAFIADTTSCIPDSTLWERIKQQSIEKTATLTIKRRDRIFGRIWTDVRQSITFSTSKDSVGAPIFFRELSIPASHAVKHINDIKWQLGNVASAKPPQTVLENMTSCANCHSFSKDGKTIGIDLDLKGDKGGYVITSFNEETFFNFENTMSWNSYYKSEEDRTMGLLSRISPDGRYVLSTVQDRIFYLNQYDKAYSFRFFPVTGILVYLDRLTNQILPLPGADDTTFVQTNGVWSPDGETIVFARAGAYQSKEKKHHGAPVNYKEGIEILGGEKFLISGQTGAKRFMYNLYRMPFNGGRGGTPVPIPGASHNSKSNYFPKISPDGKWLVYTQARSFMLAEEGSTLFIVSMDGGESRRMQCSIGEMNSWHSWSPNSRWIVFSSKVFSSYTELWLTHVDDNGNDSVPVLLNQFVADKRAANIPEFVNIDPKAIREITVNLADVN